MVGQILLGVFIIVVHGLQACKTILELNKQIKYHGTYFFITPDRYVYKASNVCTSPHC
jgi:hypothetical protein